MNVIGYNANSIADKCIRRIDRMNKKLDTAIKSISKKLKNGTRTLKKKLRTAIKS